MQHEIRRTYDIVEGHNMYLIIYYCSDVLTAPSTNYTVQYHDKYTSDLVTTVTERQAKIKICQYKEILISSDSYRS